MIYKNKHNTKQWYASKKREACRGVRNPHERPILQSFAELHSASPSKKKLTATQDVAVSYVN